MRKSENGFTIVELLIVIVVIGILATITIVSYNGIQQRSKNAQISTVLQTYVKALRLYEIDNGKFPGAGYAGMNTPCLGTGYTGQICSNVGTRAESSTFNALLDPYLKSTPATPTDTVLTNNGNAWWSGVIYEWASASIQNIRFVQLGTQDCPVIGGVRFVSKDVAIGGVLCVVTLN